MKKTGLLFLLSTYILFAMSYEKFKEYTLKHSKVLKIKTLSLQTTEQENNILLRTKNPTLDLEASRFDQEFSSYRYGYSISASQTVRTGNYMDGLKDKAYASTLLRKAFVTQGKAGYIKTLERLYTEYVYQNKLLFLLKQEYRLSNSITNMVKERYKIGSENKVAYLQAKTETLALKTQRYTTNQQISTLYYQLLAIAGFREKVSLEKQFIYTVSSKTKNSPRLSPRQQVIKAKEKIYQSDYSMNKSSFQSYDVYAGMEKEPDQSILRFGISIPLPLHHDRSEERMLSKLKMQQLKLDSEQLSLNVSTQKQMLKASIKELAVQYRSLRVLQKEQQELAALLKEGYTIAQGSLFQLMNAKGRLIQTRKRLLQTQRMINDQKIELHFLQGHYND